MKNKIDYEIIFVFLILIIGSFCLGYFVRPDIETIYGQSQCYTNLQPSEYFYTTIPFVNIFPPMLEDIYNMKLSLTSVGNSGSMRPTISDNSILILLENPTKKDIKVGDIISTKQKFGGIIHRVIEINGDKYITKGDNNDIRDKEEWLLEQIDGKVVGVLY